MATDTQEDVLTETTKCTCIPMQQQQVEPLLFSVHSLLKKQLMHTAAGCVFQADCIPGFLCHVQHWFLPSALTGHHSAVGHMQTTVG